MRSRDFYILGLSLGGLLFSFLTLIASCRKGVMNSYTIAAYSYDLTSVVYPPENSTTPSVPFGAGPYAGEIEDDIHWWFFTANYLSICGGYVGGTEDPDYVVLECQRKPGGYKFRTDDPFIVNFLSYNGEFPVNSTVPLQTITTAPSFATLVIGITFSVFSMGSLAAEAFGGWSKSGLLAQASVGLLGVAATFLTISSGLITSLIKGPRRDEEYLAWNQQFEALTWAAVAFMYLAFLWKLSDFVYQKERRRRLLTTGQI